MSEIDALAALFQFLGRVEDWTLATALVLVLAMPSLLLLALSVLGYRALQALGQKLDEMAVNYNNNIIFVRNYEKLVENHQALMENMLDTIKENVRVLTLVTARIDAMQTYSR